MRTPLLAAAFAATLTATAPASVEALVIDSVANGTGSSGGDFASPEILVGDNGFTSVRNFFVFDLAGAPRAFTASITLFGGNGNLDVPTSETFELHIFSGDIDTLVNGSGGVAAFDALGAGSSIGGFTITGPTGQFPIPTPELTVDLTSDFVDRFNSVRTSADPRIALGGVGTGDGVLWERSFLLPAARLNIDEVPEQRVSEPGALGLLGLSATLLLVARRRAIE